MNQNQKKHDGARYRKTVLACLIAGGALGAPQASAFKFENESVKGSFDSTISFGIQKRMQGRDCSIIGNDNGGCVPISGSIESTPGGIANGSFADPDFNYLNFDDGDLNYNKHDLVSAALKGTHELALNFGNGLNSLVRGTWVKDFKADDTRRTPLSDQAKDIAVTNWTWLDAWVSKDFSLAGRPAKVKLGNQVISWGEDVFIYGGVNVTNAIDLRKFHTPGTQLKEIFRPAPMISLNTGLTDNLSLEAYYQWNWNAFRLDPVGTYFSTADVVGKGVVAGFVPTSVINRAFGAGLPTSASGDLGTVLNPINVTTTNPGGRPATLAELTAAGVVVPFEGDKAPDKKGQFGVAMRYKADNSDNEYGFYYIRFHDKLPQVGWKASPGGVIDGFFVQYGEDRDLYGMSLNTKLGEVAVGAEISYRPKDSVGIDPTVPGSGPYSLTAKANVAGTRVAMDGFVDEKRWQAHLTGFYFLSPSGPFGGLLKASGAAEGFVLAEAAVTYYPNLDRSGAIPYILPNYDLPTRTSSGYVVEAGITYPDALGSGINVTPQIDFAHDVHGVSPNLVPFVEGRKAFTFSLNFDYQSKWKGQLAYTSFWGGGNNNLLRDRDFLGASVAYSF